MNDDDVLKEQDSSNSSSSPSQSEQSSSSSSSQSSSNSSQNSQSVSSQESNFQQDKNDENSHERNKKLQKSRLSSQSRHNNQEYQGQQNYDDNNNGEENEINQDEEMEEDEDDIQQDSSEMASENGYQSGQENDSDKNNTRYTSFLTLNRYKKVYSQEFKEEDIEIMNINSLIKKQNANLEKISTLQVFLVFVGFALFMIDAEIVYDYLKQQPEYYLDIDGDFDNDGAWEKNRNFLASVCNRFELKWIIIEVVIFSFHLPPFVDQIRIVHDQIFFFQSLAAVLIQMKFFTIIRYLVYKSPLNSNKGRFIVALRGIDYSSAFLVKVWLTMNTFKGIAIGVSFLIFQNAYILLLNERQAEIDIITCYQVDRQEMQINQYRDSIWLTMVTFLTIGYGDFYPTTNIGRYIMIVTAMGGQLCSALIIGLIHGQLMLTSEESGVLNIISNNKKEKQKRVIASTLIYYVLKMAGIRNKQFQKGNIHWHKLREVQNIKFEIYVNVIRFKKIKHELSVYYQNRNNANNLNIIRSTENQLANLATEVITIFELIKDAKLERKKNVNESYLRRRSLIMKILNDDKNINNSNVRMNKNDLINIESVSILPKIIDRKDKLSKFSVNTTVNKTQNKSHLQNYSDQKKIKTSKTVKYFNSNFNMNNNNDDIQINSKGYYSTNNGNVSKREQQMTYSNGKSDENNQTIKKSILKRKTQYPISTRKNKNSLMHDSLVSNENNQNDDQQKDFGSNNNEDNYQTFIGSKIDSQSEIYQTLRIRKNLLNHNDDISNIDNDLLLLANREDFELIQSKRKPIEQQQYQLQNHKRFGEKIEEFKIYPHEMYNSRRSSIYSKQNSIDLKKFKFNSQQEEHNEIQQINNNSNTISTNNNNNEYMKRISLVNLTNNFVEPSPSHIKESINDNININDTANNVIAIHYQQKEKQKTQFFNQDDIISISSNSNSNNNKSNRGSQKSQKSSGRKSKSTEVVNNAKEKPQKQKNLINKDLFDKLDEALDKKIQKARMSYYKKPSVIVEELQLPRPKKSITNTGKRLQKLQTDPSISPISQGQNATNGGGVRKSPGTRIKEGGATTATSPGGGGVSLKRIQSQESWIYQSSPLNKKQNTIRSIVTNGNMKSSASRRSSILLKSNTQVIEEASLQRKLSINQVVQKKLKQQKTQLGPQLVSIIEEEETFSEDDNEHQLFDRYNEEDGESNYGGGLGEEMEKIQEENTSNEGEEIKEDFEEENEGDQSNVSDDEQEDGEGEEDNENQENDISAGDIQQEQNALDENQRYNKDEEDLQNETVQEFQVDAPLKRKTVKQKINPQLIQEIIKLVPSSSNDSNRENSRDIEKIRGSVKSSSQETQNNNGNVNNQTSILAKEKSFSSFKSSLGEFLEEFKRKQDINNSLHLLNKIYENRTITNSKHNIQTLRKNNNYQNYYMRSDSKRQKKKILQNNNDNNNNNNNHNSSFFEEYSVGDQQSSPAEKYDSKKSLTLYGGRGKNGTRNREPPHSSQKPSLSAADSFFVSEDQITSSYQSSKTPNNMNQNEINSQQQQYEYKNENTLTVRNYQSKRSLYQKNYQTQNQQQKQQPLSSRETSKQQSQKNIINNDLIYTQKQLQKQQQYEPQQYYSQQQQPLPQLLYQQLQQQQYQTSSSSSQQEFNLSPILPLRKNQSENQFQLQLKRAPLIGEKGSGNSNNISNSNINENENNFNIIIDPQIRTTQTQKLLQTENSLHSMPQIDLLEIIERYSSSPSLSHNQKQSILSFQDQINQILQLKELNSQIFQQNPNNNNNNNLDEKPVDNNDNNQQQITPNTNNNNNNQAANQNKQSPTFDSNTQSEYNQIKNLQQLLSSSTPKQKVYQQSFEKQKDLLKEDIEKDKQQIENLFYKITNTESIVAKTLSEAKLKIQKLKAAQMHPTLQVNVINNVNNIHNINTTNNNNNGIPTTSSSNSNNNQPQ